MATKEARAPRERRGEIGKTRSEVKGATKINENEINYKTV